MSLQQREKVELTGNRTYPQKDPEPPAAWELPRRPDRICVACQGPTKLRWHRWSPETFSALPRRRGFCRDGIGGRACGMLFWFLLQKHSFWGLKFSRSLCLPELAVVQWWAERRVKMRRCEVLSLLRWKLLNYYNIKNRMIKQARKTAFPFAIPQRFY